VAQSVGCPTLGFNSGHDLRVVGLRALLCTPCSVGSLLEILALSLCPSPLWNKQINLKKILFDGRNMRKR